MFFNHSQHQASCLSRSRFIHKIWQEYLHKTPIYLVRGTKRFDCHDKSIHHVRVGTGKGRVSTLVFGVHKCHGFSYKPMLQPLCLPPITRPLWLTELYLTYTETASLLYIHTRPAISVTCGGTPEDTSLSGISLCEQKMAGTKLDMVFLPIIFIYLFYPLIVRSCLAVKMLQAWDKGAAPVNRKYFWVNQHTPLPKT